MLASRGRGSLHRLIKSAWIVNGRQKPLLFQISDMWYFLFITWQMLCQRRPEVQPARSILRCGGDGLLADGQDRDRAVQLAVVCTGRRLGPRAGDPPQRLAAGRFAAGWATTSGDTSAGSGRCVGGGSADHDCPVRAPWFCMLTGKNDFCQPRFCSRLTVVRS